MNGWNSTANFPPPKDGTEVMFCRRPPFSATGNVTIGFWHDGQNVPGWQAQGSGGVIVEEHHPYWQWLPQLPDETKANE